MNVKHMTMPKAQARRMLREYRDRISKKATEEHRAVAEALKWMARGRAVINLGEAVRGGGFFTEEPHAGMPRLAICRSDMKRVTFEWNGWGTTGVYRAVRDSSRGPWPANMRVVVDMGREHGHTEWSARANGMIRSTLSGRTMVPMVPPAALQQAHTGVTALGNFYTLWEVERWTMTPPHDPMLLRHVGGDLYVVAAEWDLTELERAVIAGTRR